MRVYVIVVKCYVFLTGDYIKKRVGGMYRVPQKTDRYIKVVVHFRMKIIFLEI